MIKTGGLAIWAWSISRGGWFQSRYFPAEAVHGATKGSTSTSGHSRAADPLQTVGDQRDGGASHAAHSKGVAMTRSPDPEFDG